MDLKADFDDDLKKYLDAPPSKAIQVMPLSVSNYDLDDEDGPIPGIQGFEIYRDDDSGDDASRLSLWPHQSTKLPPETQHLPNSPDAPGMFCREWVEGSRISNPPSGNVDSSKAPLVAINLFGRRMEDVISKPDLAKEDHKELEDRIVPEPIENHMVLDAPSGQYKLEVGIVCVPKDPVEELRRAPTNTPLGHSSPSSRIILMPMNRSGTNPSTTMLIESHSSEESSSTIGHSTSFPSMESKESRVSGTSSSMDIGHSSSSILKESDSSEESFSTMDSSSSSTLMDEDNHSSEELPTHMIGSRRIPAPSTLPNPALSLHGGQPPLASLPIYPDRDSTCFSAVRALDPAKRLPSSISITRHPITSEDNVKSNRQRRILPEGSQFSINRGNTLPRLVAAVEHVLTRDRTVEEIVKARKYYCPAVWCGQSFSRPGDADRHFKTAAIHRSLDDRDTRCTKCGEELSRADARKRHELKDACGKRRIVRKPPGPPPFARI